MTITFQGGTKVVLNPPIPTVTVKTDVTAIVDNKVTQRGGITIRLEGRTCHVIQLVARIKKTQVGYSTDTYSSSGGIEKQFSPFHEPVFTVDSLDKNNPYYDEGRGAHVREGSALTIWDKPTMESSLIGLLNERDWSMFIATCYLISDGGLIGIVRWFIEKEGELLVDLPSKYTARSVPMNTSVIESGREVLQRCGYKPQLLPPAKRINMPTKDLITFY